MSTQSELLKERTMQFALDVLRLIDTFPRTIAGDVIGHQLAKAATSSTANYLDVSIRKTLIKREAGEPLRREAHELRSIFGRSVGTARANAASAKRQAKRPVRGETMHDIKQSIDQ
jgi:hypothetical protein